MITPDLRTAFSNYVALTMNELSGGKASRDSAPVLLEKVGTLEGTDVFRNLVDATQRAYPADGMWIVNLWRSELGNFFRRTGFYENVSEGRQLLRTEALFEKYQSCLQLTHRKVRYLAPIDAIDFGITHLDLGDFSIRKFSVEEIDDLFENDSRKVFYPASIVQSKNLADYWCLDVTIRTPRPSLDSSLDWDFSPSFQKEISSFPKPIENALKRLVLFDWQSIQTIGQSSNDPKAQWEPGKGWCRFYIPAVLSMTDDLFSSPGSSVAIPPIDQELRDVDDNGEEIWVPSYLDLSDDERMDLTAFVARLNELIPRLTSQKKWLFLDVALGFIVKAFFSEGLEQLLWHIAVVESLLGENKEGLNNLLARRVACITGKTRKQRPTIMETFKELYSFRSNLVHGNREILDENKIYVSHLREARQVARETLIWFLNWLDIVEKQFAKNPCVSGVPERTDLLSVLDMNGGRRSKVNWLINTLPAQFPNL
jgi:Apea-like HEPN